LHPSAPSWAGIEPRRLTGARGVDTGLIPPGPGHEKARPRGPDLKVGVLRPPMIVLVSCREGKLNCYIPSSEANSGYLIG
jgi:hypothetical protein